ncbi:helix-turn-helix domain-containing protein [uncultured Sphaerochaeta sp.]|uniref:helix-turn-helix domain-containing protein n=1 Tax=uncultured Sphaerochaeta sp. TaxID=886478 RepID=UPI002A0A26DE|nr:helix-turn-helix domain-containing protein [uncultured Sphaerochaeta sp.]
MIIIKVQNDIIKEISIRARTRRLELNLTQTGLALRSGVSLGSIKRFETTGEISLSSLLDLALVLDCLDDFSHLFNTEEKLPETILEMPKQKPRRERGRIT